jgi:hypothetical protein
VRKTDVPASGRPQGPTVLSAPRNRFPDRGRDTMPNLRMSSARWALCISFDDLLHGRQGDRVPARSLSLS